MQDLAPENLTPEGRGSAWAAVARPARKVHEFNVHHVLGRVRRGHLAGRPEGCFDVAMFSNASTVNG